MDAIVTAGGVVEANQPLYPVTRGGLKSMLGIAGKPMVQWVLDALSQARGITQVVVVGLPPATDLLSAHPLTLLPDHGSMLENVRAGAAEVLRRDPAASHAVLATGDIPTLRGEMVDWLIEQCGPFEQDIYYTLLERPALEAAFPSAQFSYTHLKQTQVVGGHLHCFRLAAALEDTPLWQRLSSARKSSLRQASILGYDALFFLMLRQLSLKDAEATICKRLGVRGKAVLCPYPEVGMDVDKPAQLEIVREYLARRSEAYAGGAG